MSITSTTTIMATFSETLVACGLGESDREINADIHGQWHDLPDEVKLEVVQNLGRTDSRALGETDTRTYRLCVPATFKHVQLRDVNRLLSFLANVPLSYLRHVRELDLCIGNDNNRDVETVTDAVVVLLSACTRLHTLALRTSGSLLPAVIPPFATLFELRQLTLANCAFPETRPLSERLVVSIAASVPKLERLILHRISRSQMHASDFDFSSTGSPLSRSFSFPLTLPLPPLVIGDDNVPDHPTLGSALSLPSLLSIPTLRVLSIRETNLGDPLWASASRGRGNIEVLDLAEGGAPAGPCPYASAAENAAHAGRVLTSVGKSLKVLGLPVFPTFEWAPQEAEEDEEEEHGTHGALGSSAKWPSLKRLHTLRLSPFFPVDKVLETLMVLSGMSLSEREMNRFEFGRRGGLRPREGRYVTDLDLDQVRHRVHDWESGSEGEYYDDDGHDHHIEEGVEDKEDPAEESLVLSSPRSDTSLISPSAGRARSLSPESHSAALEMDVHATELPFNRTRSVETTQAALAPVLEHLFVECFEDDAVEICEVIKTILVTKRKTAGTRNCMGLGLGSALVKNTKNEGTNLRRKRRNEWCLPKLSKVEIVIGVDSLHAVEADLGCDSDCESSFGFDGGKDEDGFCDGYGRCHYSSGEASRAAKSLREVCRSLGVACVVPVVSATELWEGRGEGEEGVWFDRDGWGWKRGE